MKPPTQRTVTLVRTTDAAPTQHGDDAHVPSAPVPLAIPVDAPFKLAVALTWPLAGETARGLALRLRDRWTGNNDAAGCVAEVLTTNAATHAAPLDNQETPLRLVVLPDGQLLIEVDDGTREFPDFDKVLAGAHTGRGLGWVSHYGGRLTYYPLLDDQGEAVGKTVQVLLPARGEAA